MGMAETEMMGNGGVQIYIADCLQEGKREGKKSWRYEPRQNCGEGRLRFGRGDPDGPEQERMAGVENLDWTASST